MKVFLILVCRMVYIHNGTPIFHLERVFNQFLDIFNIKLKLCAKRVLAVREWFWWFLNNGTRDAHPLMAKFMTNFHISCDLFPYATSFISKYIRIWYIILGLINMSYSVIECFLGEKKLCQPIWEYSTPALLLGDFRWTRVLEGGWKGLWPDCSPCNFHRNVIYTKRIFSLPPSTIFVWMNSLF